MTPEQNQPAQFLSGDSHGRVLSHAEGGYTYTRDGKTLFQASHGSRAIDLFPEATPDDVRALAFALGGALLALAAVPAPVGVNDLADEIFKAHSKPDLSTPNHYDPVAEMYRYAKGREERVAWLEKQISRYQDAFSRPSSHSGEAGK